MTELQQFFGCYFHQDWDLSSSSDQEAIQQYLNDSDLHSIEKSAKELRSLIVRKITENQLDELITSTYKCSFDPNSNGSTYIEWITTMHATFYDLIRKHRG
ncbi:contact-dependent growth inhibition system immunity protein [Poriferisphaera sp. WC338]|uniref:contact-dependent growth inhibition system immunity protein n=1 Tax=Poriferisphaera sp. WC338 TaxID=3425129 RepID=UPI003D819B6A